jgi:signal transduction histidine kinase
MLEIWLHVVALVSLLDVLLSFLSLSRYSLGWYTSRASSLIEAIVLLCALLYEVNHMYKRLAHQNNELLKQHAMQNNFISVVSHEFRTALTSIQGFSEIMLNEEFSPEEAREFAGDMNSDAHRISRLIGELLDLDRMKSGTMKLVTEQVAVNMLIEEVISRMRPTTSRHLIRCELDRTIPLLWGDHDKLVQVLTNLISNAIKYSPDGGEIVVKNWREKDIFHLTVRDHGMGIPPDQLEMVFERYIRVDSTKSRYVSGTGLGLPIVRQIIEMHSGQAWAESTSDQGATFHITLPLTRIPALTAAHA